MAMPELEEVIMAINNETFINVQVTKFNCLVSDTLVGWLWVGESGNWARCPFALVPISLCSVMTIRPVYDNQIDT